MTRDEFIRAFPMDESLDAWGVKLEGTGKNRMAKCPFHGDKNASMSVNLQDNTWFCHACKVGGGVIDFLAKMENLSIPEFLKSRQITSLPESATSANKAVISKVYSYQNATGKEVYQALRYEPKTFRQRRPDGAGGWLWNMQDVERVLYRLPEVIKAQTVWIVEGEKDVDSLAKLGFVATTNVGGAGKWLDAYSESLAGKDVIICGDNDKPGQEHVELVFESLAGKVKSAKLISLPPKHKDVSDYISYCGEQAKAELERLAGEAVAFVNGVRVPLFTLSEIEPRYRRHARNMAQCTLDLSKWLPSLRGSVRGLVPGELVLFLGDTGIGKTAILQSIAFHANPLPTILFEMELPEELVFERFIAIGSRMPCKKVEEAYRTTDESLGDTGLEKRFGHILICTEPRLNLQKLEGHITRSELKFGCKPVLVLIDYVQLLAGTGNRYERTSDAAEGLKVLAKSTRTIVVVASQVHRCEYSETNEIGLHSGKDSGSLENSAGLVIGAWRDDDDPTLLHMRILKNTKGGGGFEIKCNFDGANMRITERANDPANPDPPSECRPTTNDP